MLHNVGLVICLVDILTCGDCVLPPGDGSVFADVTFRLLVFRPIPRELLRGRVKEVDRHRGLRVSLEFFEDVFVPPNLLRADMVYQAPFPPATEGAFHWRSREDLSLRRGDHVLLRVQLVLFGDASHGCARAAAAAASRGPPPRAPPPGDEVGGGGPRPSVAEQSARALSHAARSLAAVDGERAAALAPSEGAVEAARADLSRARASKDRAAAEAAERTIAEGEATSRALRLVAAGGEAGDGVHVPRARAALAEGGAAAELAPPPLLPARSLRALLGHSAASRGVSGLDAAPGEGCASGSRAERLSRAGVAAAAGAQLRSLLARAAGGGGESGGGGAAAALAPASVVGRQAMGVTAAGPAATAAPFSVFCSIQEEGLGNVVWWGGEEEGGGGAPAAERGGDGGEGATAEGAPPAAAAGAAPPLKRARA